MQFPCVFYRTASFSDSVPNVSGTAAAPSGADNTMSVRTRDSSGLPLQRVAVVATAPATAPATLTASLYVYETATGNWWQLGNSLPLQVGVVGSAPGKVVYFDAFSTGELPQTVASMLASGGSPASGSATFMLVVTNPGALPSGSYVFAMAPVYTATP